MISIVTLREALSEIVSTIPEINTVKVVSTDDRFVDKLEKHKQEDNTILICVIPAFGGFKTPEEIGGYKSYLQFFILNKIDYKTTEPEDVQTILQPLVQDFLKAFAEHTTDDCYTFGNLDWTSVAISSITNKASCCGWEIQITDKTYTGIDGRIE